MLKIPQCLQTVNGIICPVTLTVKKKIPSVRRISSSIKKTEVSIPTFQGNIAGVLWESTKTLESSVPPEVPVICLHGIQDNCGTFDPLLPLLMQDKSRTFFAADFAGHGRSYHTKGLHYGFLEETIVLKTIFQHFQWEKAVLLGHSYGAVISFIFATIYPDIVHKYIALENMRPVPSDNLSVSYAGVISAILKSQSILQSGKERPSYPYSELINKVFAARNGTVNREGCEILMKRGAERVTGTDLFRFSHDLRTSVPMPYKLISAEQSSIMASNIRCPMCVIKGDPGVDYEPLENFKKAVEDIRRMNPNPVEYHTVPGTHHFHLNTPELVAPIIDKFLNS